MDSLKELKLNYNSIHKLRPKHIKRLRKIENLQIGANALTLLPKNIDALEKIKTLNLGRNEISDLPLSFKNLKSLEHIILYENNFSEIPDQIWALYNLKRQQNSY
jgi:Leucine-rich repeat (LRR) protein